MLVICFSRCNDQPGPEQKPDLPQDKSGAPKHTSVRTKDSVNIPAKQGPKKLPDTLANVRPGKHLLTLQWISWDRPGSILLEPMGDGWFNAVGEQRKAANGDYLTIKGRLKPVSKTELLFEGTIETKVNSLNGGEPCIRQGPMNFKTTRNRKYWRLQNMLNCEGNLVTDYIDIYF